MTSPADLQLVTRRVIKAPRALVFDAFIDPQHIGLWWGPNGFTTTTYSMEPKVGGKWRYTMHGPDGKDWPNVIAYTEISKPERICYDHGEDDGPPMFKVVIDFEEEGAATVVTLRTQASSAEQIAEMKKHGAVEGARQTLERLERFITKESTT